MAGAGRAGRTLVDGSVRIRSEAAKLLPTRAEGASVLSASIAPKRNVLAVDLTLRWA
jgi:hypothetical protein